MALEHPTISVIMPCFNAAKHVVGSMRSALGQTFSDLELLMIDDGSTDDTVERIRSVNDRRVRLVQQPNKGVSAARNRGIAEVLGTYIAFLDADDAWVPACLEKLHAALCADSQAVLAYCGWQNVGLSGPRGAPFVPPDYEGAEKLLRILPECPWPIHAVLTRTEAVRGAGGFNERFGNAEDFGLWLEIAAFNKIARVPEVLAFYNHHEGPRASSDAVRAARQGQAMQWEFVRRHPQVKGLIGRKRLRELIEGRLLYRGYERYWARDLPAARDIFCLVMRSGYGSPRDWKYMLPSLLPLACHRFLVERLSRPDRAEEGGHTFR